MYMQDTESSLALCGVVLYPDGRRLQYRGQTFALKPLDRRVFERFLRRPTQVFTRDQLLESVWRDPNHQSNVVDKAVSRIRVTLEDTKVIEPVYGTGYRLGAKVFRAGETADDLRPLMRAVEEVKVPSLSTGARPLRDSVIKEPVSVLRAVCDVVESAARQGMGPILIASTGQVDLCAQFPTEGRRWESALRSALKAGIEVIHLWRIDRDRRRLAQIVGEILQRIGSGYGDTYQPHYFRNRGYAVPPHDLLITPAATLVMLGTNQSQHTDAGILTTDGDRTGIYREYFWRLREQTEPLMRATFVRRPHVTDIAWEERCTEIECQPGDRFLFKRGLTAQTRPEAAYHQGTSWWNDYVGKVDVAALSRFRLQRLHSFKEQIGRYRFEDICPLSALEKFATSHLLPNDEIEAGLGLPGSTEDVLARFIQAREMMEYPNYKLLLADRDDDFPPVDWAVKNDTVILETVRHNPDGEQRIDFILTESTIAGAFRDLHQEIAGSVEAYRSPDETKAILDKLHQVATALRVDPPDSTRSLST